MVTKAKEKPTSCWVDYVRPDGSRIEIRTQWYEGVEMMYVALYDKRESSMPCQMLMSIRKFKKFMKEVEQQHIVIDKFKRIILAQGNIYKPLEV